MTKPLRSLLNSGIVLLLWIPLFIYLGTLFAPTPLTSHGEDRLLWLLIVGMLCVLAAWKRLGAISGLRFLPVGIWIYLFILASRAISPDGLATLGWFTILYLLASLFWDGDEKQDKKSSHAVAVGLIIGTAFLLTADLMLVIIQPSAIPIAIPQFWLERIGFLWPLSLGALLCWRLSETSKSRLSALTVMLIVSLVFGLKEYRWETRIEKSLLAADEDAKAGDSQSARKQLEQVRRLNTRKQKPGVIPAMRKIRARLYLQENNILGAFFEVKHCLKENPQETENLLPLLDSNRMQEVAQLPLTRLNDLRLMVDMEPSLVPGQSFVLDRWGRVFLNTKGTFQKAFNDSLQPCTGEDPADLEILPGDRGAVVMSKHGHFFFYGEVPDSVRSLLETARIPSQTYVDFEFNPSMEGAWLLSDRGPIIAVGKTRVEIPYEDQIQWPYSIARDLEVEPNGKGLYLMDGLGSVHTFGVTSVETTGIGQPYWTYECAVDIEWLPDKKGFYLLTNWGEVYVVGDGLTRNTYKIPKTLQATKDMPYAIALQVSSDANRVDILESNGGITQVTRHIQNPGEWLDSIKQEIANDQLREAVQSVQQFVDIAPEQKKAALELLDATFCQNYASTPLLTESEMVTLEEEPTINFAIAVDVEQTDLAGVYLILDRWGRIWQYDGSSYLLKKSVTQYGPGTGLATDLEWIPSASTGLILYDRGVIEIWGKGNRSTAGILEEVQPTGEGWIDLEPVGDGRSWVVANAFGGFHVLGQINFTLPDVGTFSWGDDRLGKDIEIGSRSGAVYLLDGNGGLHAFGQAAFPIKGEGYPYFSKDRCRALAFLQDEKELCILNRSGEIYQVGKTSKTFYAGTSTIEPRLDFVDIEISPDGTELTFLEGNFRVTTEVRGEPGIAFHQKRISQDLDSGHFAESLIQLDHLLETLNKSTQQQKALEILPPESMLALGHRLASKKLTEKERALLTNYFNQNGALFVAQESENETVLMLDCFGRIYRHSTDAPNDSVEIVNPTPISDLHLSRAIDFVGIDLEASTYYVILDTRGQVHLKPPLTQGPLADLVKTINSDPLNDALKLVLSADGQGAVVMNRDGFLREYGSITIPESELQRVGWPNYPIARDLKLSSSNDGLALLDGMGSVHTVGSMTSLPPQDLIPWYGEDIARAMTNPDGGPVWMIDRFGRIKNWGQAKFKFPFQAAMLPRLSAGEAICAIDQTSNKCLSVMTNWGRLFIYHPDPKGSQFHLQQYQSTDNPLERIRHFYTALASDPGKASSILTKDKINVLVRLNDGLETIPGDYWQSLNKTAGLSDTFEFFTDIKPGPSAEEAYVLNRWGQVLIWDSEQKLFKRIVQKKTLTDPIQGKAVSLGVWNPETNPGFLIMDATGGLTHSGSLPEFLKNSAKKVGINLLDAQEILFSNNGEAVYILDGTGRIAFLGRSRLPLKLLPGDIWNFSIARGFVLSPDEKGFYLLDGHGVVHPFGETQIPVKSNNSAWSPDDEARALCLDASGNGLYLANRKGEIFAFGHPTDPVSKEIWPRLRTEMGEELIRMAYDSAGGQFWILTNKGRIERIPFGSLGAKSLAASASGMVIQDRPLDAWPLFLTAVDMAPDEARNLLHDFSPIFADTLRQVHAWECSNLGFWVDMEAQPNGDSTWLLDRWGEIYQDRGGLLQHVKEYTHNSTASDMLLNSNSEAALILYYDGKIETWGEGWAQDLLVAIEEYNRQPLSHACDLEWTGSSCEGLFVLSGQGEVQVIGKSKFDVSLTQKWHWDEDMAAQIKASPDGKALFLLDRQGGVHKSGESQIDVRDRKAPYFNSPGMVAGVEWSPGYGGFYFLDALGAIHTVGKPGDLPAKGSLPYFHLPCMVDFEIQDNGTVILLTENGRLYRSSVPLPDH